MSCHSHTETMLRTGAIVEDVFATCWESLDQLSIEFTGDLDDACHHKLKKGITRYMSRKW